jgi:hypothetical protein
MPYNTILKALLPAPLQRIWWFGGIFVVLQCLVVSTICSAAGAISQGYTTRSDNISRGALVSLVSNSTTTVEPATSSNAANLVGVAADKPLIELSGSGEGSTQVVVGGSTEVLVSDVNGSVKAGDKIAASPIGGIGMKASEAAQIVGTAQVSIDSAKTVEQSITAKDGTKQTIKVGLLSVAVNVTYYSASMSKGTISSFVPPFLQSIANSVVGREVSPLRVLLGAIVLLLGFIAVIVMIQTSIRNGLISLGRNPLAQKAVRRGLIDIIVAAIGLLVLMAVIVYVVLVV